MKRSAAAGLFIPPRLAAYTLWACLIGLSPLAQAQEQGAGPPPAIVRVGLVKSESVQPHRLVIGNIVAAKHSRIAAELAGRVLTPPPDAGRSVKAGDVLVETDTTLLSLARAAVEAQREQARALQDQRQAAVRQAQRQAESLRQITERSATNDKEFKDAQDSLLAAQAALAQAQAAETGLQQRLAELDEQIQRMTIKAPFTGVVLSKQTEIGEWLEPGDVVAEIVQTAPIDAVFDAPETLLHAVTPGIPVPITLRGLGGQRDGVVDRVVPQLDRITRTFPVVVRLPNADGFLKPGMTAEALAPTGPEQQALTLPRDAVRETPQGTIVYTPRNGVAAAVPVRVLFETPGRFAIQTIGANLQPGDHVVIEGNEWLFPGQPLTVMPAPGTAPKKTPGTAPGRDLGRDLGKGAETAAGNAPASGPQNAAASAP